MISLEGPIPDLKRICGDPKAPEDKRTSLFALIVKNSPLLLTHSTPIALLF